MKNVPINLHNSKNKEDKLDIEKLETAPFDLNKLSNVGKNNLIKSIEDKIN